MAGVRSAAGMGPTSWCRSSRAGRRRLRRIARPRALPPEPELVEQRARPVIPPQRLEQRIPLEPRIAGEPDRDAAPKPLAGLLEATQLRIGGTHTVGHVMVHVLARLERVQQRHGPAVAHGSEEAREAGASPGGGSPAAAARTG